MPEVKIPNTATSPSVPFLATLRFGPWTNWQTNLTIFQIAGVLAFLVIMLVIDFENTSLLLTTGMGIKLLVTAFALLGGGVAASWAAFYFLDRRQPAWLKQNAVLGRALPWILGGLQAWFFLRPAVLVVLNGGAVIHITQTLLRP